MRGEPERYAQLVAHWPPVLDVSGNELSANALSPWLLVVGILPAIAFVAWRSRNATAIGNRMLLVSLIGCGGLLLLLDQTKTSLYAILLLPSVCMALAAASVTWVGWGLHQARTIWRRVTIGSVAGAIAVCIALEGAHAYQVDWLEAASVTPYLPLGAQIDSAIAPDTVVLGPERWWWVLREHPYVSLRSTWFQWAAAASTGGSPQFADWVIRTHPATIIVNVNVRGDVPGRFHKHSRISSGRSSTSARRSRRTSTIPTTSTPRCTRSLAIASSSRLITRFSRQHGRLSAELNNDSPRRARRDA